MPKAEDTQVILALTQFSLHALRAESGTVVAGGECALENKAALDALLDKIAPTRSEDGIKAAACVWPTPVSWYVSTDTEALLDRTADALRAIAFGKQSDQRVALAYAACNAGDGGTMTENGADKWVMAFSTLAALERASTGLLELKVDPKAVTPAMFASVGAVGRALRMGGNGAAVALWDLGIDGSNLLLVTGKGVEAAVAFPVGMESIYEAVQSALKLKFRGAGARLFYTDTYDFTDAGPKIAAIIGPALKEALAQLPSSGNPPMLACPGLTGRQAWFVRETAAAAGIPQWEADIGKLAAELGFKFSDAAVQSQFSVASIGVLELLSVRMRASDEWIPDWSEAEPLPEEEPEPEPAAEPEPEPAPRPIASAGRPKPSLTTETAGGIMGSPPRAPRPVVLPKSATTAPMPVAAPPAARPAPPPARPPAPPMSAPPAYAPPAPSYAPAPATAPLSFAPPPAAAPPAYGAPPPAYAPPPPPAAAPRPASFSNPSFPVPAPKVPAPPPSAPPPVSVAPPPGTVPKISVPGSGMPPPVTALPFEAISKLRPLPGKGTAPPFEAPAPERKSRVGFYIGIGVVAALIAVAIGIVLEARMERAKANDLEEQEALAHHVTEQRLKEAEIAAKVEAARSAKEMAKEVEDAKRQAEDDTRKQVLAELEAERLSKLPGTITVATDPAGAAVSIDGAVPLTSPAKADGLKSGTHKVQISLAGYDSVAMNAEVMGSKTTDLGVVRLVTIYGSMDLSTSPDGLEFAIRPAADPNGKPIRTGRTPASIDDIPKGDYTVTFSRPGCRDHVADVSVARGARSPAAATWVNGALELSSEPSGANVSKDGAFLGTTPLVLHDLTPKVATFELTLPGYDPTPVSCQIPEGDTLKFSAQILRKDRVFTAGEVKTAAQAYESPEPSLSSAQRKTGADVLLSLVVRRDGSATNVEVVRSTDDDIARRCKAAVEKWKFHPATAPDDRTVESAVEVPFKFPGTQ
jgi:TonB family protein